MENCSALYWEIMRIGQKWVSPLITLTLAFDRQTLRLDVANLKNLTINSRHDFRNAVKKPIPKPDSGGTLRDAEAWLRGDQWDGVMNYDAFMEPTISQVFQT